MSYQSLDLFDKIDVKVLTPTSSSKLKNSDKSLTENESIVIFGKDLRMTRPQLVALSLLSSYFFLSAAYFSLFAPFFPSKAISKKISQTQVGIIFGVFEFVVFILSPYFGKHLQHYGIRFLFVGGLFINSGSQILFGFLDLCPEGLTFFIMCIACRAVTGIGVSMGLSFAIVGHYFPERVSFFVSLLEVFNGLGFMIGPVIGGFLYQLGGFETPFFVMGGFLFLQFIFAYLFFPDTDSIDGNKETLPMLPFFKIPRFVLTLIFIFMCALSIGFTQPSIEIHLLPLQLSPIQIALIMMFPSLIYIISTPLIGFICDKFKNSMKYIMLLSAIVSAISFSLIAPIPILNMKLNLVTIIIGYLGFGLSIGGLGIPGYSELLRLALKQGHENDIRIQGVVSGFFSSTWSLGSLVGPIFGGYIVDMIGFEMAASWIVLAFLILVVISALFLINDYLVKFVQKSNVITNGSQESESTRLLEN